MRAVPQFKTKCFSLVARPGALFLEIESGKNTTLELVYGLLEGLSFTLLMQLNSELLGLINKAGKAGIQAANKALSKWL